MNPTTNTSKVEKFNEMMNKIMWHPFTLGFIAGMWFSLAILFLSAKGGEL